MLKEKIYYVENDNDNLLLRVDVRGALTYTCFDTSFALYARDNAVNTDNCCRSIHMLLRAVLRSDEREKTDDDDDGRGARPRRANALLILLNYYY